MSTLTLVILGPEGPEPKGAAAFDEVNCISLYWFEFLSLDGVPMKISKITVMQLGCAGGLDSPVQQCA